MNKKTGKGTQGDGTKTIARNKRARFDYHIEERIEAGLGLLSTAQAPNMELRRYTQ